MSHLDQFLYFLDKNGDGTGGKDANEDYSGVHQHFLHTNDHDKVMVVEDLTVYIQGSGSLSSDKYGTNITLTNGIQVLYIGHLETVDFTDGKPILINTDWGSHAGLIQDLQLSGGTKKSTAFTWNLPNSGVKVRKGESFSVLLKDNFSDLEQHTFKIQGRFA